MKVEDCIVAVERRSTGGCLDLAFVFARQFAVPLIKLTAWFAVPSVLLSWWVASSRGRDVLISSALIFGLFSLLASASIVTAVGPQVFGVPITTAASVNLLFSRLVPYLFLGALIRLTGFCVYVPLLIVLAWCGHLPEVLFLERLPLNQLSSRFSQLCQNFGFLRNLGRVCFLVMVWCLLSAGVFLTIDLASGALFHRPIFFGTFASGPDLRTAVVSQILDDAAVVSTFQVALWLSYPVIRVAWFFCYLDQRIRNECWDLELQIRVEAIRLQEPVL